jgi:hypothetical protein
MSDEKKQTNSAGELNNKHMDISIAEVTIFKDKPELIYIYKKTEKLVSATYMLSGFITDREPIKWQLREAGVELLSNSLSLSDRSNSERIKAHHNFVSTGLKFLSLLEVSYVGGLISEMNYSILKNEFQNLISTVESVEKGGDARGLIFPDHFFDVPNESTSVTQNISKGQSIMSDRIPRPIGLVSLNKQPEKSNRQAVVNNRQEIIISLLRKNNELGIKDFTSAIKDCSEKTIQRELTLLISKGQITKTGEKRWSRYSLKS